jgi:hypothetical protein
MLASGGTTQSWCVYIAKILMAMVWPFGGRWRAEYAQKDYRTAHAPVPLGTPSLVACLTFRKCKFAFYETQIGGSVLTSCWASRKGRVQL